MRRPETPRSESKSLPEIDFVPTDGTRLPMMGAETSVRRRLFFGQLSGKQLTRPCEDGTMLFPDWLQPNVAYGSGASMPLGPAHRRGAVPTADPPRASRPRQLPGSLGAAVAINWPQCAGRDDGCGSKSSRQGLGTQRLHCSFAIRGPGITGASGLTANAEARYHRRRLGS
jgi:hypothetical protein